MTKVTIVSNGREEVVRRTKPIRILINDGYLNLFLYGGTNPFIVYKEWTSVTVNEV